jgi:hypothetical protein
LVRVVHHSLVMVLEIRLLHALVLRECVRVQNIQIWLSSGLRSITLHIVMISTVFHHIRGVTSVLGMETLLILVYNIRAH